MTTVPISTTRTLRPTTRVGSCPVRSRAVVVPRAAKDARELAPPINTARHMHYTKDGKPSLVPQDVPHTQSAAVGLGGAVVLFAFGVWRIDRNKKKEQAYWIEQGRETEANKSGGASGGSPEDGDVVDVDAK
jgi:hypothetical protein